MRSHKPPLALAVSHVPLREILLRALVHPRIRLRNLQIIARQQITLIQLNPRTSVVPQTRLHAPIRHSVHAPPLLPQPVETRLQSLSRRHTLKRSHDSIYILVAYTGRGNINGGARAPERGGQDGGDGGVGAAEREVGEVALGGVEPGEEEGFGVDGVGGEERGEAGLDGGDGVREVEAGADYVEAG